MVRAERGEAFESAARTGSPPEVIHRAEAQAVGLEHFTERGYCGIAAFIFDRSTELRGALFGRHKDPKHIIVAPRDGRPDRPRVAHWRRHNSERLMETRGSL